MRLPGFGQWLFAAKTCAASLLALYIALKFDLPRPYWAAATVYITSQPFAGATRSKAFYRLLGTAVGAMVAVVLVANLATAPMLLCLAMALWVAVCLYASLLDRTPRGYLFMLAGYTAPLIGFPCVDDPGIIFETAVARTEEIGLGILCATLVSSLVLPQPITIAIVQKLDAWLSRARDASLAVLVCRETDRGANAGAPALSLAVDALTVETLATHLGFESSVGRRAPKALATLRQHMMMLLPMLASVADRIDALRQEEALSPGTERILAEVGRYIGDDDGDPHAATRLRAAIAAAKPVHPATWVELLVASLMVRLNDVVNLRQDTLGLVRYVAGGPSLSRLRFRYTATARLIRHRDHGMALLSAIGVLVAILATCAVWIETAWPDGSGAPMFAAVVCCFFAAQDDPAPAIIEFAHASIVGSLAAALYLFAILPLVTTFEGIVLTLSPSLILCGLFMQQPKTAGFALGAAVVGLSLLAIQSSYVGDLPGFTNSAIAVCGGMGVSAVLTRVIRSVDAAWSGARLLRINRRTLAASARGSGSLDSLALAALMLDRIALAAPRLDATSSAAQTDALLAEVRAGITIAALRRCRAALAPAGRHAIDRVMAALPRAMAVKRAASSDDLLAAIDAGLRAAAMRGSEDARLALVGLRRALYPAAPIFVAEPMPSLGMKAAA